MKFFVSVWLVTCPAWATITYNAAADWSNTNNPNGVWSYCSSPCAVFPSNGSVSGTSWAGDFTGGTQVRWSGGGFDAPGMALSNGTALGSYDLPSGVAFGHAGYDLRWTSPDSGTIDISGNTWMIRDLGRTVTVTVLFNGSTLGTIDITRASGNSGSPVALPGGASLSGIAVSPGDFVDFQFTQASVDGDYAVINATVELTPAPEPATILLSGAALLAVVLRRKLARP